MGHYWYCICTYVGTLGVYQHKQEHGLLVPLNMSDKPNMIWYPHVIVTQRLDNTAGVVTPVSVEHSNTSKFIMKGI